MRDKDKEPKLKATCKAETEEERKAILREMSRRRWAKVPPKKRVEFAKKIAAMGAGRPRSSRKARCPCGAMTLRRARARADNYGTGLGHLKGCSFFRLSPRIAPKGSGSSGIKNTQNNSKTRK